MVLTPSVVIEIASRISSWNSLSKLLVAFLNPMADMFVNFVVIPTLIMVLVEKTGLHKLSD